MAMRDQIYEAIMAGGATKESLLELTGTTEKGLASQMTYLRMTGRYPMKNEDGTFRIATEEEWEAHKATSGTATDKTLTPEERVEKAQKRSNRASTAFTNASKRLEADPDDRLTQLKAKKAECELEIAEIELGIAESALRDAPISDDPDIEENEDGDLE